MPLSKQIQERNAMLKAERNGMIITIVCVVAIIVIMYLVTSILTNDWHIIADY